MRKHNGKAPEVIFQEREKESGIASKDKLLDSRQRREPDITNGASVQAVEKMGEQGIHTQ